MSEESLLADADVSTPDDESTETTTETPAETSWQYAEGLNGEGDKPEWFKDGKYKSVADQAKAYAGLESKLGGFTGAPEEYEVSMPEDIEGFEFAEGDQMMGDFQNWAKEKQLSQEGFTELLHMFVKNEYGAEGVSRESELKAIGDNAGQRLKNIDDFAKANLSEDEYEGILAATTTAAGVKAVEALIAKTRGLKIPADDGDIDAGGISHSDIKERMNDPRYQSDPAFRKETFKMYEKLFGKEPKRTTVG